MARPTIDLTGQRFGRLVVTGRSAQPITGVVYWDCLCDCGNVSLAVKGAHLKDGSTQSCGCLGAELTRERMAKLRSEGVKLGGKVRHGHTTRIAGRTTPSYASWQAMMTRCTNQRNGHWKDYGGRGITVCERWKIFENFLADMGERPDGKTLDRIDTNGNYEPGNCRWGTPKEQANNRRR